MSPMDNQRLTFLEQQLLVMRQDFERGMVETGKLFQQLIQINRSYQTFVEERLGDIEQKLDIVPAPTEQGAAESGKEPVPVSTPESGKEL